MAPEVSTPRSAYVRLRPPRWVRSVRQRPAAFSSLVALSALTVIGSTLTPMLLGSVAAADLAHRVAALRPPDDGVAAVAQVSEGGASLEGAQNAVSVTLASVGGGSVWGTPQTITQTGEDVTWRAPSTHAPALQSALSVVDGCTGVHVLVGRCPKTAAETAIPSSVIKRSGLTVGTTDLFVSRQSSTTVRVVGVYDDRAGVGKVLANPGALVGSPLAHPVPNPIIGSMHIDTAGYSLEVDGAVSIRRLVRSADVPELLRGIKDAKRSALSSDAAQADLEVSSGLDGVLSSIQQQQAAAVTLTTPVALEALGLGWFAVAFVMQRTARARSIEWGIGRSRGLKRRTWLAGVFLEPAIAILAGALLGAGLSVLIASAASAVAAGSTGAVDPFAPFTIATAVLALAGSLVALVVASATSASVPLDTLLRDTTEPRQVSRFALVGQVAAVLATAAVLWSVFTTRLTTGPQLALALPLLTALLVGVTALRLTVVIVRRTAQRPPRSLIALVAGRGLARAPSVLAGAVLMLVAGALAAYSLDLDTVSARAEDDRAALAVGASSVAIVHVPTGVSLLAAVRSADPTGRAAMAVEETDAPGDTGANRIVALDSTRVNAISTWKAAWRGVLLSRLRPSDHGDLTLTGRRLSLTLSGVLDGSDYSRPMGRDLQLFITVAVNNRWKTIELGPVRNGRLSAAIPCAARCRIVSLDVSDPLAVFHGPWGVTFALSDIATDTESASRLSPRLVTSAWRNRVATSTDPALPVQALPYQEPGRLIIDAQDGSGAQTAELEPASGPVVPPAIGGSRTDLNMFAGIPHAVFGSDLAGRPLLLQLLGRAPALPRSLSDGVVVDLGQLDRFADPSAGDASKEVWFSPGTHPAVIAALAHQHVRVIRTITAAAAQSAARRTVVPRSIGLVRVTAITAIALALLALIAAWVVDVPVRRREWRALQLSGIPLSTLRRIAVSRFLGPVAVAVVLGIAVAVLAFAITFGQLPLRAGEPAGPPIDGSPPWAALGLLAAVLVALAGIVGAVGARMELRKGHTQ